MDVEMLLEAWAPRLGLTLALSIAVCYVYRLTHPGRTYSRDFVHTLMGCAVIMTLLMGIVAFNIALSIGMFGAVSVVRFRNAVQESRDMVFIFLSIAIGLAAATEQFTIAIVGTLIACGVFLLFHWMLGRRKQTPQDAQLEIRLPADAENQSLELALRDAELQPTLTELTHSAKGSTFQFRVIGGEAQIAAGLRMLKQRFNELQQVRWNSRLYYKAEPVMQTPKPVR